MLQQKNKGEELEAYYSKLTKALFGFDLSRGQAVIVKEIVENNQRLILSAHTRYGKTQTVSLGLALRLLLEGPLTIALIGPRAKQANRLRDYLSEVFVETPLLRDFIAAADASAGLSRLKREASKNRVTLKDGSEYQRYTAHGEGEGLMGSGADIVVVDESVLIEEDTFDSKIYRFLGDNPNAQLIEIVNPWHRGNHSWKHWQSDRFTNIHIDWRQGVREHRQHLAAGLDPSNSPGISKDFVDEQREQLSDYHFKVLYESIFPDEGENTLIKYKWITSAKNRELEIEDGEEIYGLDVAEGGADLNVLTKTVQNDGKIKIMNQWSWNESDTMKTVKKTKQLIDKPAEIRIDAIGVGKGVADRLSEEGVPVQEIKVSKKPADPEEYLNLKAQTYYELRKLFENGDINISNGHSKLESQLAGLSKKYTTRGKMKIINQNNKSPDFADSLMLAICSDDLRDKRPSAGGTSVDLF